MHIDDLINRIIPPADYEHREGFNNVPILDNLSSNERITVEETLIKKLLLEDSELTDTLIVETLAYLKSDKALQIFYHLLARETKMTQLVIASSIYEINHDNNMVNIAIEIIKKMDDKENPYYIYTLSTAFYYLSKFNSNKVDQLLTKYSTHSEYLISYNAKRFLNY